MIDWKEYKLGDICSKIGSGATPRGGSSSYIDEGISLIRSQNVLDFLFSESGLAFINDEQAARLSNVEVLENDVLLNITGDSVARCCIVPKKYLPARVNQHVAIIRPKVEQSDYRFIHYYLLYIKPDLLSWSEIGGTRRAITKVMIENIPTLLPPLPEQKAIAEVLSSLDDKIDLLHRHNQTLEAMAETLFRQWFVEEAGEDWEEKPLSDIAEVQNGFAFRSKDFVEFEDNHLEVLKMGHIEKGGGLRSNPKKDFVPRENRLERWVLKKGDIVMAMTDMKDNVVILGVPAMIDKDDKYVLNQRVARIYLKNHDSIINDYMLYIQLKNPDFIAELQSTANSGVQVNLSTESIKNSLILVPPIEIQKKLGNTLSDFYLKKELNVKQIKTLEKQRDTLLPKLMSGAVRVKT